MNRSYRNTPQQRNTRQNPIQTTNFVSGGFTQVGHQTVLSPVQPAKPQVVQQQQPVQVPVQQEAAKVAQQDVPMAAETENGSAENVKIVKFHARSGKVSAKLRRARANRRLRKLLCPKTAVMALHELRSKDVELDFKVSDNPINGQFKAETVYEGKTYVGFGAGKQAARNNVAEKILRDMVIERMKKNPKKSETDGAVKKENGNDSADGADIEMADVTNEDEEVPMTHLASYALHKLFAEWAKEGYEVPDFRAPPPLTVGDHTASAAASGNAKPHAGSPKIRTELPPAPEKLHPAMLLQIMRPGTQYTELGSQGITPNIFHAIGVTVDGQQYIGSGKSKKIARKEAARSACEAIFKVKFEDESEQAMSQ
ncbi:double-stranded RNA-specific editase 1 [Culicoides brevitarsis]|uniref:double-stranded RNA-specific editase 1 n=1 Tax=Culicoides brevitarsis TaxID=469753 RepID=UPI00307C5118